MIALLWLLALALLPALYAAWRMAGTTSSPPPWRLTLLSTLAFALAFNLVFLVQEWFLVWPKSLVAGLEPTLFHNNHTWRGTHPDVDLLQGTGALGTLLAGALAWYGLARHTPRREDLRLLMFWLALLGFLSALPQFVLGAALHANDVGRAMTGLGFSQGARWTAAALSSLAMAGVCWRLAPYLLTLGPAADDAGRARTGLHLALLPALLALPLIVPFRIPNHAVEVLLPPAADGLIAGAWTWAAAWHVRIAERMRASPASAVPVLGALLLLWAFFQFVLARGVEF
jgi:hypothetical protein